VARFQTVLQKLLKLGRFKANENSFLYFINELAFIIAEVQFANSFQKQAFGEVSLVPEGKKVLKLFFTLQGGIRTQDLQFWRQTR
jgi:hypothetical protein